jgi:hypothetical protein
MLRMKDKGSAVDVRICGRQADWLLVLVLLQCWCWERVYATRHSFICI